MSSSEEEIETNIETEDGILTTKNVKVDYKNLEAQGAEIKLSDDELTIQKNTKPKKVAFDAPAPSPSKQYDAKSVASTASKASRISKKSTASKIEIENDRLSVMINNLGLNEDEINFQSQQQAEARYKKMVEKKFKVFIENSEKIRKSNETSERNNISIEELYKMPRHKLLYENEKLKVRIQSLEKQRKELDEKFITLSKRLEQLS
ncbi:hypothetical protein TVAG_468270 [Trichomonas vaginalis G3]|uniref:Uncharacterized protein n=1 Tax=Trichomonas vaginalis (strain ATCC PRA-98 / G3) TaxID=412133 RepID=A2E0R6_TRIV3|nr:hypothetical protein TVAGG3_0073530 [Trichomonas vaginalis G3]EAY13811.1 hypothetical protein TVAG_468270 [Trichomonas vaginalis G3]KAI5542675.1 hypothetical protein TVAGG3_0073530 [Trichomonas vaginalis G3]|eukprot:XP_001326034.1 hypothetical protein [Trichomonas vaginalis G3]